MEKTFLEKRIEQKAEERVEKEFEKLCGFVINSEILKNLDINIGDDTKGFMNLSGTTGNVLFNGGSIQDAKTDTNILEIKKNLLEKYIKEETDILMKKMEGIEYLLNKD